MLAFAVIHVRRAYVPARPRQCCGPGTGASRPRA
jgi:hypothetical protein